MAILTWPHKMRYLGSLLLVLGVATATVAAAPVANEVHLIGPPAALAVANELHRISSLRNACVRKCHLDDGPCLLKCMDGDDKTCLAGCSNDGDFYSCVSACVKKAFPGAPETAMASQHSSCFDQDVCYNSCEFQHDSYCKVNCNYEYYWNCQHACGVDCPAFIKTTRPDVIPSTARPPSEHYFGRPVIWLKSCPQVVSRAAIRDHGHLRIFNSSSLESPEHHDCAQKCCALGNTNVAACVKACPGRPGWP